MVIFSFRAEIKNPKLNDLALITFIIYLIICGSVFVILLQKFISSKKLQKVSFSIVAAVLIAKKIADN